MVTGVLVAWIGRRFSFSSSFQNLLLHGWSHWGCLSLKAVEACRSQWQPQSLPWAPTPPFPRQGSSWAGKLCSAIFCWCFLSAGKVKRAGKTEKKVVKASNNYFLLKEACLESVQVAHMSILPLVKAVWVIINLVILHLSLWLLWAEVQKPKCSLNAHELETVQDSKYLCPACQRSPPHPAHSTEPHTSPSVPSALLQDATAELVSSFPQPSPAQPWALGLAKMGSASAQPHPQGSVQHLGLVLSGVPDCSAPIWDGETGLAAHLCLCWWHLQGLPREFIPFPHLPTDTCIADK